MRIDKAVQRLGWRISYGEKFKPNDLDLKAINSISDYVENTTADTVRDNFLFAKLFIYFYWQNLKYFGATVFDKEPIKDLSEKLDIPLENYYKIFTERLNDLHREQVLETNGISTDHKALSDDDKVKIKRMKDDLTGVWDIETVRTELDVIISEALNRFR